ncbi:hypothetical protein J6590_073225 [Homalodisca vitripennis]|nr:hypothetical protein J6590_073225 [Homalodisca vitripennis]
MFEGRHHTSPLTSTPVTFTAFLNMSTCMQSNRHLPTRPARTNLAHPDVISLGRLSERLFRCSVVSSLTRNMCNLIRNLLEIPNVQAGLE